MTRALLLLAALWPAGVQAETAASSLAIERGGVVLSVPAVLRDGGLWIPVGSAAREALAPAVAVTLRFPFVEFTRDGRKVRIPLDLGCVWDGEESVAWIPDPVRLVDGVPVLSRRSLAGVLVRLEVVHAWRAEAGVTRLSFPSPADSPSGDPSQGPAVVPPPAGFPATSVPQRPVAKRTDKAHIVIDPGHGGMDCGARSRRGLCEKVVTLDIALRLRRELEARGIRVTLTREGDRTLSLSQRVDIAAQAKADLFVSLHVNASRNRYARGVETYVYGQKAGSAAIADLVRRENAEADYVDIIVNDLQQRLHHDASIRAAGSIEDEMVRQLRMHGRSGMRVKEAPFYVLARARRPAVLLEIGFISNATEEAKLRDSAWRQKVATTIGKGLVAIAQGAS